MPVSDIESSRKIELFKSGAFKNFPLAPDASLRKYFRVFISNRTYIIMDASKESLQVFRNFILLSNYLRDIGVKAPAILEQNSVERIALIEDLGELNLWQFLRKFPCHQNSLYKNSIDILLRIQAPMRAPEFCSFQTKEMFESIISRFSAKLPHAFQGIFLEIAKKNLDLVDFSPQSLVMRDYHSPNIVCDYPNNFSDLGVIDFQDAIFGRLSYDLVSLLQDPRRVITPYQEEAGIEYYLNRSAEAKKDKSYFKMEYKVLGVIRAMRILCVFLEKAQQFDYRYIGFIPRVKQLVKSNLNWLTNEEQRVLEICLNLVSQSCD